MKKRIFIDNIKSNKTTNIFGFTKVMILLPFLVLLLIGLISVTFSEFLSSDTNQLKINDGLAVQVRNENRVKDIASVGANVDIAESKMNVSGGGTKTIYFMAPNAWTSTDHIYLLVGKNDWTERYKMTKCGNTKVYFYQFSGWTDMNYIAFVQKSDDFSGWGRDWGSSNVNPTSMGNNNVCGPYTGSYTLNENNCYHCAATTLSNNKYTCTITHSTNWYSYENGNYKLVSKLSTDGGTSYSESKKPGTATLSGYYLSGNTSSSDRTVKTDSSASTAENSFSASSNITLSHTENTGYEFVGFYNGTTKITTTEIWSDYTKIEGTTTTIDAKWKAKSYNVTLTTNGGTINSGNITSYTYSVGATLPTDVTKTGYNFDGWYTANTGGNEVKKISTSDSGNKTYYAHWSEKTATLTYNDNSGSGGPGSQTMYYTTVTNISTTEPQYPGYKFKGWSATKSTPGSGSATYTKGQQYKAANVVPTDATLYAVWELNSPTFTVTSVTGSTNPEDPNVGTQSVPYEIPKDATDFTIVVQVDPTYSDATYSWSTDGSTWSSGDSGDGSTKTFRPSTDPSSGAPTSSTLFSIYCKITRNSVTATSNNIAANFPYYKINNQFLRLDDYDYQLIYNNDNVWVKPQIYAGGNLFDTDILGNIRNDNDSTNWLNVFSESRQSWTSLSQMNAYNKTFNITNGLNNLLNPFEGIAYLKGTINDPVNNISVELPDINITVGTKNDSSTFPIYFVNETGLSFDSYRVMACFFDSDDNETWVTAQNNKTNRYRFNAPSTALSVRFYVEHLNKNYRDSAVNNSEYIYAYSSNKLDFSSVNRECKATTYTEIATDFYSLNCEFSQISP